jgi:hypothetical protein
MNNLYKKFDDDMYTPYNRTSPRGRLSSEIALLLYQEIINPTQTYALFFSILPDNKSADIRTKTITYFHTMSEE